MILDYPQGSKVTSNRLKETGVDQMGLYRDCPLYGLTKEATLEQWDYLDAIHDKHVIFSNSGAGTGKTTLAVAMAKYLIEAFPNLYKRARYIFSAVEEGTIGYRPGNTQVKESSYLTPLRQALVKVNSDPMRDILRLDEEGNALNEGWIHAHSHTFERGTNYDQEIVIFEEAQNATVRELKKILTRVHTTSKIIIIGHSGQIDLPNPSMSGFYDYIEHFRGKPYAAHVPLTHDFRGFISRHADSLHLDTHPLINDPY